MNKAILIGRLTKDVDLRQNGDSSIARFSLAVDRRFKDKDGNYGVDFLNIVCFSKQADFATNYLHKGMKVAIEGRIQTGSYTNKEGQKIYTTDIVADSIEFCESKSASADNQQVQNNTPAQNTQVDADGFMSVADDIPEELPFN